MPLAAMMASMEVRYFGEIRKRFSPRCTMCIVGWGVGVGVGVDIGGVEVGVAMGGLIVGVAVATW